METRDWLTAAEMAELQLPGLPTNRTAMARHIANAGWRSDRNRWHPTKNPSGVWRRREGQQGGPVEFHIALLPTAARTRLMTLKSKVESEREAVKARLARDDAWRRFDDATEARKERARRKLKALVTVTDLTTTGVSKDAAVRLIGKEQGFSASSYYGWEGKVAGIAREDWLPYLMDHHAGRTVTAECSPEAWDMLKSDYLRLERPPFSACYARAQRAAKAQGWTVPPERTLLRRLQKEVPPAVIVLAREGADAVKRMYPAQERDRSMFHALQAVNGDGHRWDIWVEWPDGTVQRPVMVAFQDLYSGKLLSWRIDQTENAWAVRLAIGDLVEQWGIPEHIWLDNGRNFASKWLTGGVPNRYRFTVRDEDPTGILVQLGMQIHWTMPYSGQSKPIERAFRDFASTIATHPAFDGAWTGNSPVNKPENYGSKAIPLATFEEILASEIHEHNAKIGRTAKACRGRSFDETFEESYVRSPITRATEEQRRLWLLAAEGITCARGDGAIKLMGNRYWADFLHLHRAEKVAARFDPDFLHDGVHVYRLDGSYLGHAPCVNPAGFADADTAREHSRQRRRWFRAQREMLDAERRMSPQKVADLVPLHPGPNARPEATVVQLARPTLDLKRTTPRTLSDDQERKHEAFVAQFRPATDEAAPPKDDKRERFERALRIEEALASGGPVGESEAAWLKGYRQTAEYRAQKALAEDFDGFGQVIA